MATVIESDGIRVEGETEQEALAALRKAKRDADRILTARHASQRIARERAAMNGYRVLSAFLTEGGLSSRHIAWCDVNKACGPCTRRTDDGGTVAVWMSTNGKDARAEWYADPQILGGLCDAGGWLVAILLKREGWFAVGDDQGETALEKLAEGFKPELP